MLLLFVGGEFAGPFTGVGATIQDSQRVNATGSTTAIGILQAILPSYPYQQYSDDDNIIAFFSSFNANAQPYLDWFNSTSLSIYTSPEINGPLLDWTAQGIYGVQRPVFASSTTRYIAGVNSRPLNVNAVNGHTYFQSGTATVATDDMYKRTLTWQTFQGDGKYTNVPVIRKRVARFIYGANGGDVTLSQAQSVHIAVGPLAPPPALTLSSVAGGSFASRTYGVRATYVTPEGEGLAGPASILTVAANHLLVVDSPAYENGAIGWNAYVNILSTNPAKFIAGVNSMSVNQSAVNGTNKAATAPPTEQNTMPIAIGTNWTEPSSGLVVGDPLPSTDESNPVPNMIITVPASAPASTLFQQAMNQGILAFPFQISATVVVR